MYHIDENQEEIRCVIPRREDLPEERGILITASSTYKTKSTLFFLLQSEYGDLYKVTLDHEKQKVLTNYSLPEATRKSERMH